MNEFVGVMSLVGFVGLTYLFGFVFGLLYAKKNYEKSLILKDSRGLDSIKKDATSEGLILKDSRGLDSNKEDVEKIELLEKQILEEQKKLELQKRITEEKIRLEEERQQKIRLLEEELNLLKHDSAESPQSIALAVKLKDNSSSVVQQDRVPVPGDFDYEPTPNKEALILENSRGLKSNNDDDDFEVVVKEPKKMVKKKKKGNWGRWKKKKELTNEEVDAEVRKRIYGV
jgi:hypothetical protein